MQDTIHMQDTTLAGFPLAPQQKRLACFLAPGFAGEPYIAQIAIEIEGPLDRGRLRRALESVVKRHEILRTQFVTRPGLNVPLQVILPEQAAAPVSLDFSPVNRWDAPASEPAPDEAFDLAAGRLVYGAVSERAGSAPLLVLALPAICADAVSLKTIARDLAESYAGLESPPRQAIQYADVTEYLNDVLATEFGPHYWLPHAKAAAGFRLKSPAVTTDPAFFNPSVARTWVPVSVIDRISARNGHGALSTEVFLLTCWLVLLSRLNRGQSITIGYGADGRIAPELADCVGLFERYIPVEFGKCHDGVFAEVFRATSEALQEATQWQAAFQWPDQSSFHFAAFSYYDADWSFGTGETTFRCAGLRVCSDRYCLKLSCVKRKDQVDIELWFDPAAYAEPEARRLASQYVTLVESACASPDAEVRGLRMVGEQERRQLIYDLNASERPRTSTSLESMFSEQSERTPDAIALVQDNLLLSYSELDRRSGGLAEYLRSVGVGPEKRVALCLNRGIEAVIGMLGILKAGGVYVPLDPEHPPERLAYLLEDLRPEVLLTNHTLSERFLGVPAPMACLTDHWEGTGAPDASGLVTRAQPSNPAYILYTSGSTGRPKGVVITREGLMNYVTWACDAYKYVQGLRTPLHTSLSFDLAITSLWPPLLTGGCIVIIPEDAGIDALAGEVSSSYGYDLVKITPSGLRVIENVISDSGRGLPIQQLVVGGEALMWEDLGYWRSQGPATRVFNEYGPTETVVGCCVYEASAEVGGRGPVPIGRPVANSRMYVLDEWGQLAPAGATGELYIGGAGLARGYWNRLDATAERFVPDEFSGEVGGRLYRTGDQVRWRWDGELEYLGRLDGQVKLRGYRIELGEIEATLKQRAEVEQVTVVMREDEPGQRRLAAYLTSKAQVRSNELREYLKERIPEYMVPAAIVQLERMPLTTNGKIDHAALPIPETKSGWREYVAPRNETEEILCGIWEKLLDVERVGVTDNFFELGGDSIIIIQIITRARAAGLSLLPKQFFARQTVAELAEVAEPAPMAQAQQEPLDGPVPLTPIQHAFFEWGVTNVNHFNQADILALEPGVDSLSIEHALKALLTHHDALRLRFERRGRQWFQSYGDSAGRAAYTRRDLTRYPEDERRKMLEEDAARVQASLDLTEGPLLCAVEYQLGGGERRLLVVAHHLVMDAVSWRIMLEDLEMAYRQLTRGEAVRLPFKTNSFRRWAERLREYRHEKALQQEIEYWLSPEWGEAPGAFRVDEALGENTVESGDNVEVWLSQELTQALLRDVPAAYHTQINEALLTALADAHWGWTGNRSLLIELEGHGREDVFDGVDLTRTVGWFTTLFPVRLQINSGHPGAALKEIKEQLRSISNRGLGYGVLRYLSDDPEVGGRLRRLPQPQIRFNYIGQLNQVSWESSIFKPAGESCGPTQPPEDQRSALLDINGMIIDGRLVVNWIYSKNILRRSSVEELARRFTESLERLIAHCQSSEAGGYTPADFPDADLTQAELDVILARLAKEPVR
jgi:amino acid adenylation domain-containing protein/non-ribosomal peptide synthase protein (TIGR01720 family)